MCNVELSDLHLVKVDIPNLPTEFREVVDKLIYKFITIGKTSFDFIPQEDGLPEGVYLFEVVTYLPNKYKSSYNNSQGDYYWDTASYRQDIAMEIMKQCGNVGEIIVITEQKAYTREKSEIFDYESLAEYKIRNEVN